MVQQLPTTVISQLKIVKLCTRTISFILILLSILSPDHFFQCVKPSSKSGYRMKGLKMSSQTAKQKETLKFGSMLYRPRRLFCKQ